MPNNKKKKYSKCKSRYGYSRSSQRKIKKANAAAAPAPSGTSAENTMRCLLAEFWTIEEGELPGRPATAADLEKMNKFE